MDRLEGDGGGRSTWERSVLELFVDLYQTHECLYDYNHQDYTNKAARRAALESISLILGKSVEDIKRKIVIIRTQFARAKQKQSMPLDDTDDATDVYASSSSKRSWFLMPRLAFLDPHINNRPNRVVRSSIRTITPRRLKRELSIEDVSAIDAADWVVDEEEATPASTSSDHLEDQISSDEPQPGTTKSPSEVLGLEHNPLKRRQYGEQHGKCQHSRRDDQCELFGRFVARELQAIDDDAVRTVTKKQIMNLIFDAQL